jgi:type II restriction enzyme
MDLRFRDNLELLDSKMPAFIAEILLTYYARKLGKATSVKKTVDYMCAINPLQVSNPKFWYPHKIKDFLEASAYGMVPTEPFNGERTAAGGLLLVEKNGDINCFRLDDKDKTRDYLVEHTYFETASRDKHHSN